MQKKILDDGQRSCYVPPVTVKEAVAALRVGRATIYDAMSRGEIPVVQIGRRKLIPRWWLQQKLGQPA